MQRLSRITIFSALALTVLAYSVQANSGSAGSGSEREVSLTARLTPANSVIVDFGHGGRMRVPKLLLQPAAIPGDANKIINAQIISLTFLFPDMVLADWVPQIDTIFEKQRGRYVAQPNRFIVRINSLFYSPGDLGNLPPEKQELWSPRPFRMAINQAIGEKEPSVRLPTQFIGLERSVLAEVAKSYAGRQGIRGNERGGQYLSKEDQPYELLMDCSPPSGLQCMADVFDKESHFQYEIIFPPEGISHTDAIVRSINKMISGWVVN